ncbi:hypothetical protein Tco_0723929 [Tanacetum coccineum]
MEAMIRGLEKLISQLEIHGETISQEDVNLKLLKSQPSEWKTHTLIWRNKPDLEDFSMNDLYNNLKIYKVEIMGSSSTNQNIQNIAFVSSNITSNTNEAVKTAHGVSAANSKNNASTLPNVDSLKEMDLKWQMAMLTMRSSIFFPIRHEGNSSVNGLIPLALDKYDCEWTRLKKDLPILHLLPILLQVLQAQTLRFMPPKPNLVLADKDEYIFSESVTSVPAIATSEVKTSESKPKSVSEPLIEDWISDSENENEIEFKSRQRKPSNAKVKFVKSNEHVKSPRESVKKVENYKQAEYLRKNCQSPRDCDYYEKKMVEKPMWNNARRVNHQNSQRITHPHPKRNFVPSAVLMKSGLKTLNTARQNSSRAAVSVSTARPINTAYPRPTVNSARPGNPQQDLKDKEVIDSGCSRHMTGNKSYLTDYEEIDGGFIAFGGNSKGGKITGKGKIRTGKFDFEDVYFVKKLKFNLFSVSQMCDKKNSVLFTDIACVVLSLDFKLTDQSHVLLKVPRKDNMYSVDLKNAVPQGGLTCLFEKATPDESNLWHRRLRHKGKQHRASCKTKTVSSISQPLQILHMDLFFLTFVKSLMKKMYCLVVTDDFIRHASIKAAPFELLYGRKCRAPICWDEVGERLIEGPKLIEITNEKVAVAKEKLKEARSRQKSYADKHRRDLEFQVGDRLFLKVSPFRGVKRFGIKGKLSPRFIGPFKILERIGEVSYRLALPVSLLRGYHYVSLLRGYHYHPLHVASYPFDQIQPDMSLSEEPESILDRQERVMRNKVIPFVKILWKNHPEREATWETEESMRANRIAIVSNNKGNEANAVKASVVWIYQAKDKNKAKTTKPGMRLERAWKRAKD